MLPNIINRLSLHVCKDYQAVSARAAKFIEAAARRKPRLLFCASAGSSPTGTYERMAARHDRNPKLFQKMSVLQIDEWGGLDNRNPATCRAYLDRYLLRPLNIRRDRFRGFRTDADQKRECQRIQRWLHTRGPIDICLLGLGLNGHIAMIEPSAEIRLHAHVAKLAETSLNHGMLKELATKPGYGLTLGMADILQSRQILLLVTGQAKRAVLTRLLHPTISTQFPASFLWLHPDVTIFCDREARGT